MKNYNLHPFFGIAILLVTFSACSKKTIQPITKAPFTYSVSGLSDIIIPQYTDTGFEIKLYITTTGGISDSVKLFVDSIPKGVTFEEIYGNGLPDFSWKFGIRARIDSPGTFPVSIRTTCLSADTQHHRFNIFVTPDTICASMLVGTYAASTTCTGDVIFGPEDQNITVAKNPGNEVSMFVTKVGAQFYLNVNCGAGLLSGSSPGNLSVTIGGVAGTFTTDKIVVNYNVHNYDIHTSATCQTVLTR